MANEITKICNLPPLDILKFIFPVVRNMPRRLAQYFKESLEGGAGWPITYEDGNPLAIEQTSNFENSTFHVC